MLFRLFVHGIAPFCMTTPYCVVTHENFCRSCRRAVEDNEMVINADDFSVHTECGTVVEERGHPIADVTARCTGTDFGAFNTADSDWLVSQRTILEAMPVRRSRGREGQGREDVLKMLEESTKLARKECLAPAAFCFPATKTCSITGKRQRILPEPSISKDDDGDCCSLHSDSSGDEMQF